MRRHPLPIVIGLIALALLQIAGTTSAQAPSSHRVLLPLVLKNSSLSTEIRLMAVADAYVLEAGPDTNTGSKYYMIVGYDESEDPVAELRTRALVKFDIPAGSAATATQATLRVWYANAYDFPGHSRDITARACIGSWEELGVTWDNQPDVGESFGKVSIPANYDFGYRDIDVTQLVQGWLAGSILNYGIYLSGPEVSGSDSSYREFRTRESEHPPELVIRFQ